MAAWLGVGASRVWSYIHTSILEAKAEAGLALVVGL